MLPHGHMLPFVIVKCVDDDDDEFFEAFVVLFETDACYETKTMVVEIHVYVDAEAMDDSFSYGQVEIIVYERGQCESEAVTEVVAFPLHAYLYLQRVECAIHATKTVRVLLAITFTTSLHENVQILALPKTGRVDAPLMSNLSSGFRVITNVVPKHMTSSSGFVFVCICMIMLITDDEHSRL